MNTEIGTTMATSRARRRRMGAGLTALPLAGLLALAGPAGASSSHTNGPPGNNGTVKIDGEAFDSHPNNEPHVGCGFEVDFYGFDKGDLNAKVTFAVQPPTGKDVLPTKPETVFIGEDSNSGGGSEAGLDASQYYDLSSYLVGHYPEHPQQGYHVKLTVNAPGSQGADTKHKVFWVEGCKLPVIPPVIPPVTPTITPTITPTDNPTVNGAAIPAVTATVMGETLTKPDVTAPAAAVAGEQVAAPAPVGGVQTGGGGTSGGGNPLLPFAAAVGFLALAGFVAPRLRRVG